MLTDEVIDEDIEALLYAQVYYGKSDTEQLAVPEQVDNIPNKEENEAVDKNVQEPDKLSEEQIEENNLSFKEHQDGNDDQQVNVEESQDQCDCDPSSEEPTSNSNNITEVSEKQDRFEAELTSQPLSQSETSHQYNIQISTTATDAIQIEKEPVPLAAQVPLLTATSNAPNQQLLNNITINQYICPGENFLNRLKDFRESIIWSKKCEKDLKRYQKGKLNEKDFFNILKRRRKFQKCNLERQEKARKAYFERQQKISATEIICLSDSDNSDIEIVSVESQSVVMKKSGNGRAKTKKLTSASPTLVEESSEGDGDGDEIIYVEPPPVPVINVEDGSDSEVEVSKEATAEIQDDASNDFLAPTNASEQFNFSLHGSEFQNAEFVRPTDPADAYETESSTTTSDFNKESNREFNNSVKTIVFDEVDFPSQDIFEGSNLDKFGELITPQRSESNLNKIKEVQVDHNAKKSKRVNPRSSSESSSESEYDAREAHCNLPDLSPMIGVSNSPKKVRKNRIKPSLEQPTKDKEPELKSRSNKKSKQKVFAEENDGILDAERSEYSTENVYKKSKKRSSGVMVEENSPKKKIKKKKTADKNVEELEVPMDDPVAPESSNILVTSTPKRPSKELPELSIDQPESSKKKNKKKKKQAKTVEDDNASVSEEETTSNAVQPGAEDTSKKKSKKRKVSNKAADQSSVLEHTTEEPVESLILTEKDDLDDGSKKKAKKRKQKLITVKEAEVVAEESSIVETSEVSVSEETSSKRKSKRNKQNSTNKSNSNELTENIEKDNEQSNKTSSDSNNVKEESLETHAGEKDLGESQDDEEDVVIIEQAVPVHTIESSDSGDDDIITFADLSDELKLANISGETCKPDDSHLDKLDIECIQSKMSDDPDKWKILSVDQHNISINKKGPRCNRCRQFGHSAAHCPNKSSIPSCTLCGYEGHQEPRCPNKVCFTCGKPGNYSTVFCFKCSGQRSGKCHLCKLTGHSSKYCPDLWRRYYLTIKEGPLITPKKKNAIVVPRSKQWCSGCASRGHLEFECNSYKWIREYPTSSPHVFDYGDVYESEKKKEDRLPASDLRNKLLQNRTRYNRSASRREIRADRSQIVDKEDTTRNESSYAAIETPAEATATVESSVVDDDIGNQFNESTESTNIEVSQPSNDKEVSADKNVDLEEHQNQDRMMHQQVSSTTETTLFSPSPQGMNRSKKSKKSRRRGKLNPLSMLKPPAVPTKFTPYHSVLNPYSLIGTPAVNALNAVPSHHDIGAPYIDTVGAQAVNNVQNVPDLALFNQIPNNLLAQQVANLMSAFSGYQQTNQMQYDFTQDNMYQGPDYNTQVPSSTYNNWHDPNYFNDPQPVPEERYIDNMRGQYDRQYTHINFQTNYMDGNRQYHRDAWTDENFRGRDYSGRDTPYQTSSKSETFVPLSGGGQEDLDTYNPRNIRNVEEATTKKISTLNISALRAFLKTEVEMLDKIKNVDSRLYKKKLNSIDQLKKVEMKTNAIDKQIYMQYKHINMYLFGLQKLADGTKHLSYLRNFVCNPGRHLQNTKRNALLNAYGYIFGGEHPNFNYRKYLNALTVGRRR